MSEVPPPQTGKPPQWQLWTRILSCCRWLGHQPIGAIVTLGLVGGFGSAFVGLVFGLPVPEGHDEFAYLLAADTFAEGRLTNPTHPHWEHFESFHIVHEPTYQAKYPPGQGLFLALGKVLSGHPAAGVWLSIGLLTGTLTWTLLVWLPPAWAILLSSLATAQIGLISYWAQSYWGGAVAGIGGALVIGAYGIILSESRVRAGLILGVGLVFLAFSRPFEGAILGVVLGIALLWRGIWLTQPGSPSIISKGLTPAGIVVIVGLGALGVYNHAVTGSVVTMPYQVHETQYAAAPTLVFRQIEDPPTYRHTEIERYWMEWGKARHEAHHSVTSFGSATVGKLARVLVFFLGPAALALLVAGMARSARPQPALAVGLLAIVAAALLTKGAYPHYLAPATALFFLVTGNGLRYLHRRARRKRTPWNLSALLVAASFLIILIAFFSSARTSSGSFGTQRESVKEQILTSAAGPHLVLVSYRPDHNYHEEWVYNHASIDEAEVVWARSMGAERDAELRAYFRHHTTWQLTVGREGTQLAFLGIGPN